MRIKDGKNSEGKRILIDGQQRVTALMTAVAGFDILIEGIYGKRDDEPEN